MRCSKTLVHVTKASFDPDKIAEMAHVRLVKKRLRTALVDETNSPSDEFCRFFLQRAGLKQVRKGTIDRYYGPLLKAAFEEALVLPAVQKLRNDPGRQEHADQPASARPAPRSPASASWRCSATSGAAWLSSSPTSPSMRPSIASSSRRTSAS